MKKYKIFNKTGLAICLTLGLVVGSACSPTDDGPSIDDHFLNYEIPQIRPSSDIPVGAFIGTWVVRVWMKRSMRG